jgi:hypothetical protein
MIDTSQRLPDAALRADGTGSAPRRSLVKHRRGTPTFVRHRFSMLVLLACTLGFAPPCLSQTIAVYYCEDAKEFGFAKRKTKVDAIEAARRICNAFARKPGCCKNIAVAEESEGCIGIAVADKGEYGIGLGGTVTEASSGAVEDCLSWNKPAPKGCVTQRVMCFD